MDTATAASSGGTIPLSPSFLGADASSIGLDFHGATRKRKVSDIDLPFVQPPPLSENSGNSASNNNNGTLTARAEPGSFRIKIQRSTPRQGGGRVPTPPAVPSNTMSGFSYPAMQFNSLPTLMPQQYPPGMPTMPNTYMPNHLMGINPHPMHFQGHMMQPNPATYVPTSLGLPPPPQSLALAPQDSLLGNEGQDLGPPPPAPPRMAVEHSLMGGGIEVQPVRAVDTRNFDWNRRAAAAAAAAASSANVISEDDEQDEPSGRPRSESLPNISLGFLDGLTLHSESSFFKEI
ncbi:hypothetical protein DYB30_009851 [Aphanomyces astaci]|uniref:Uncharacterized protein n=1 Tax=Aphanomyces astaci TaxID=112090 RepID=A0A397D1W9_APHAT|nr:hypothetical protein DYB30_009851 [Aphanomyces astaci]